MGRRINMLKVLDRRRKGAIASGRVNKRWVPLQHHRDPFPPYGARPEGVISKLRQCRWHLDVRDSCEQYAAGPTPMHELE
jgi:hypothetical protein